MAKITPRPSKKLPEILPCKCGDIGVTVRPRGGKRFRPWSVYCLSPTCGCHVRGFEHEAEAILAWNEEVTKK